MIRSRSEWAANEYDIVFDGEVTPVRQRSILRPEYNLRGREEQQCASRLRNQADTNEIIRAMTTSGKVVSFNPSLPSMNEIFIRVVEAKNKEAAKN
ncbi:MAG: DUF4162 domain-containing protein [Marinilabiliales bacterium]|nr:DUF4162 domain-containing protein [Marinilabiliales bacterium]